MVSRSKVGHDAHSKGFSYQNVIAHKFSDWANKDFHSTPASGSLHWSPDVYGDVMTTEIPEWHSLIECKKYDNASIEHYCYHTYQFRDTCKEETWWSQTMRESIASHSVPLLVYAGYHTHNYIVFPYNAELLDNIRDNYYVIRNNLFYYTLGEDRRSSQTLLMDLDDFLEVQDLSEYLGYQKSILNDKDKWDCSSPISLEESKDSPGLTKEVDINDVF
jgi:hypothetical protein